MKEIVSNPEQVAFCGLYCGACKAYLREKCDGCRKAGNRDWCKIRACCLDKGYTSCADCREFENPNDCSRFNNFISKVFGFVFRSDRAACVKAIRDLGIQGFADNMAESRRQTIKK
ncbi:MAG: hypothetical protein CVV64_20445 [Candidatus Wallbacteria bacterium HGW-Wallbacteria-1]|uniref:DUF3795 domain-containing protein n=1 Tax=Candidatus Wallbacteria bacterium HGW-Wallbacteria-1 TaxID=2013854 RepID=A0A2N1PIA9_9BACT|nr:MAG: hypothetical protein CVV64_20445 [Candidatus Wallbacteria bacterium HGW-Wallbacteria-1]